jgi:hypothetical protein
MQETKKKLMLYTMLKWLSTVKSIRRQRDLRMTHFARINIAKAGGQNKKLDQAPGATILLLPERTTIT